MNMIKGNRFRFCNQTQLMQEAASAHRPWLLFAGSTLLSPARCRMGFVATVQGRGAVRSDDNKIFICTTPRNSEMMFNIVQLNSTFRLFELHGYWVH